MFHFSLYSLSNVCFLLQMNNSAALILCHKNSDAMERRQVQLIVIQS